MVYTNTPLGNVGNSGYSTGPHLHFQVNTNGSVAAQSYQDTLNPLRFYPQFHFNVNVIFPFSTETLSVGLEHEPPATYYMLDSNLIENVGETEYKIWLDSVDIEHRNVPGFLAYFIISDQKCTEILTQKGLENYYEVDQVFEYRDSLAQKEIQ